MVALDIYLIYAQHVNVHIYIYECVYIYMCIDCIDTYTSMYMCGRDYMCIHILGAWTLGFSRQASAFRPLSILSPPSVSGCMLLTMVIWQRYPELPKVLN